MVKIPPYGKYQFSVTGVQVEGYHGFPGVSESLQPDVQFEWESRVLREHKPHHLSDVVESDGGFSMDKYPVTNAQCVTAASRGQPATCTKRN